MKKILMLAGACALLLQTSCKSEHQEHVEETKFLVSSPIRMDTTVTKDYVCQIHSIQHIELRALEKGYLQHIYVDEGQFVKQGQPMFQILPLLYKAELQKAEAEAEFLREKLKNTREELETSKQKRRFLFFK